MKIVAFGDIHMATSTLSQIEEISSADLIIVSGDITNFGDSSDAKVVLDDILGYNKNLLCLAGNMDNSEVNDYLDNLDINLHAQAHMVKRQVCVYGVGGSNPTPFGTPWELSENRLHQAIHEAYEQAKELIELALPITGSPPPTIFVSHAPPYGTKVDRLKSGKHVGSKAIRKFIESKAPALCVASHIHESKGVDHIGPTPVVNPGMLADGGWIRIDITHQKITYTLQ